MSGLNGAGAETVTVVPTPGSAAEALAVARAYAESVAADERYDLSRHWRNARTHASHDPVARKYHHTGEFMLNDVLPPTTGSCRR